MDQPHPLPHPFDLPADDAAALVKRERPELGEDGKPTGVLVDVAVRPDEVFANRLHGDVLVVVTTDGEKLSARIDLAKLEAAAGEPKAKPKAAK